MDTNHAKNIIIVLLLVLNAALLVCNIYLVDAKIYTLGDEASENIEAALMQNNIILQTEIIRNYEPLGRYETDDNALDTGKLTEIFLPDKEDIEESAEGSRKILRSGNTSLSVNTSTGFVVYRDRDISPGKMHLETARNMADSAKDEINRLIGGFVPDMPKDTPYETEEGWIFEYRQTHDAYIINNNYLIVTVGEKGVSRAEFLYGAIISPVSDIRPLIPPDAALITFMHEINNIYGPREITVVEMSLVYHRADGFATPFYRVRFNESSEGILINAYTNNVEYE